MRAQLILVGGRQMPNMLTILHEKPDIIAAITSQDKKDELPFLAEAIKELLKNTKPDYILDTAYIIDAFNLKQIEAVCTRALNTYPGADWLFNITSATTIMSIGAYEVAKEHPKQVKWWYLDTAHTSVVTLSGSERNEELFKVSVREYLTASYCTLEDGDFEAYRTVHETHWLPFAQSLGKYPHRTSRLKDFLQSIRNINKREDRKITQDSPQSYKIEDLPSETLTMLEEAAAVGIVDNWDQKASHCSFLLSELQYKFLDGTWLEVYTWKEIQQTGIFSDYEWGKKIKIRQQRSNQLDAAMIYKAKLLIAECKTGTDAFKSETFQTLESISNALGRNFVTRILITSLPVTDDDVKSRAKSSGIYIIQRDDLPNLGLKLVDIATKDIGS